MNMQHATCLILAVTLLAAANGLAGDEPTKKEAVAKEPAAPQFVDDKDLAQWRVIAKNDFEKHGKVFAKDGELILEQGQPATGVAWSGEPPRMNYEVTLEAKRVAGDDFFCGLTFPIDKSYCTLIVGGWGGSVTGLSNIDNFPAVENETTGYTDFKPNRWYRIRLRVTPEKIEAWIDDDRFVNVETKDKKFSIWWEQEPVRPLGIASWNTTAVIRKLRVKRL